MGLFDKASPGLFDKTGPIDAEDNLPEKKELPVKQVLAMREQGYDNNQIIQTLQRDGYGSSDIFDAMSQADLQPKQLLPRDMPASDDSFDSNFDDYPPQDPYPRSPPMPRPQPAMQAAMSLPQQDPPPEYASVTNEELIEAMIDEKWNDLLKDVNKIIDWKNATESKISAMEQKFDDLKDSFDRLHEAIIGKIGEYDKNILNVSSEIKAMEKVFSKVLPVFTKNVSDLNKVTATLKRTKK
ncbi:MAG: hypothetical protein ABIE94_01690 [archaeon]